MVRIINDIINEGEKEFLEEGSRFLLSPPSLASQRLEDQGGGVAAGKEV